MKSLVISFFLFFLGILSIAHADEFDEIDNPLDECPLRLFDKAARVFDSVMVCGTPQVPRGKLRHAARVIAQWLDQRGTPGVADEPAVVRKLRQNNAVLVMFRSTNIPDDIWDGMFDDGFSPQQQFVDGTDPANPSRRDETQEEAHHLIHVHGWGKVYGWRFDAERPGPNKSTLWRIWKKAENRGYYFYDDPTCEEECKVVEFLYKALAVYHGSKPDIQEDEIRIKTKSELEKKLPGFINLIESDDYVYPTKMWPNGKYKYENKNIEYIW